MDQLAAARAMTAALRRQIAYRVFGANFAPAAALALFAGGACVLAGRLFAPQWRTHILIWVPTVLTAAAFIFAALRTAKRTPPSAKLLVYLDTLSSSGGLLNCIPERDASAWLASITLPPPPAVSLRHAVIPVLALLSGMAFLTGAALLPVNRELLSETRRLDISREQSLVSEKIELLESTQILAPERAEKMRSELERLAAENRAEDAAAVYDQLDSLEKQLADLAAEAEQNLNSAMRESAAGASFAEAAMKIPEDAMDAAANRELAELASKLGGVTPELAEKLAECAKSGKLDQETLKKLAEACKKRSKELSEKMNSLCKGGMCGKCQSPGGREALKRFLEESNCSSELAWEMMEDAFPEHGRGNGGTSRGRGDAGLYFDNNTSEADAFGRDISLGADGGSSDTIGKYSAAPGEDAAKESKAAVAGNLQTTVAGREQRRAAINPAHRRTVDWYLNKISDKEQ